MNDNHGPDVPPRVDTDAHGQAALMLTEAMLHALVEARVFTTAEALSIVETAIEVKIDLAEVDREVAATLQQSLHLLGTIAYSLRSGR